MSGEETDARGAPKPVRDASTVPEPDATSGAAPESAYVLIVEDEAPIAEALSFIIEDAGFAVRIAVHGKHALEMVREQMPALILTDLMMPQLDGAELITALRALTLADGHTMPPVVLMTAGGLRRAQQVGADALLRKPFSIAEVEALLHRFLG